MTPWILCGILYVLGAIIVFEDMRAADLFEPEISRAFRASAYLIAVGIWPILVAVILANFIIEKIRSRS